MALLQAERLVRSFGGVIAVDGVSLSVEAGTIAGLIGPNGAGKTTFFNIVAGSLRATAGKVIFDGRDVTSWRTDQRARIGLTRTFQIARGLLELTVLENLMLYGIDPAAESLRYALLRSRAVAIRLDEAVGRAWEIAEWLKLDRVANRPVADLSGGQKKMLELGRALMAGSKIVLLDEPAAGVSRSALGDLVGQLVALRARGMTFLIVEHDMGVIGEICDRVVVLAEGRRIAEGTFEEIKENPDVQAAYLGGAH